MKPNYKKPAILAILIIILITRIVMIFNSGSGIDFLTGMLFVAVLIIIAYLIFGKDSVISKKPEKMISKRFIITVIMGLFVLVAFLLLSLRP